MSLSCSEMLFTTCPELNLRLVPKCSFSKSSRIARFQQPCYFSTRSPMRILNTLTNAISHYTIIRIIPSKRQEDFEIYFRQRISTLSLSLSSPLFTLLVDRIPFLFRLLLLIYRSGWCRCLVRWIFSSIIYH